MSKIMNTKTPSRVKDYYGMYYTVYKYIQKLI